MDNLDILFEVEEILKRFLKDRNKNDNYVCHNIYGKEVYQKYHYPFGISIEMRDTYDEEKKMWNYKNKKIFLVKHETKGKVLVQDEKQKEGIVNGKYSSDYLNFKYCMTSKDTKELRTIKDRLKFSNWILYCTRCDINDITDVIELGFEKPKTRWDNTHTETKLS